MSKVTNKIRINADQAAVWNALENIGAIQNFHPTVKRSYTFTENSGGIGAGRYCEFYPMGKVREEVVQWDPLTSMTLKVEVVEKMPPMKNAKGGFELKRVNDNTTEVTMVMEYGMKYGPVGAVMDQLMVRSQFEKTVPKILQGLKRHVETGEVKVGRDWLKPEAFVAAA